MKSIKILKNRYVDSVSLMSVGEQLVSDGLLNAEAQMATPANLEVLASLGYEIPSEAGKNDLVLAVTAEDEETAKSALEKMEQILDHRFSSEKERYLSLQEIDLEEDPYDLVQISLPGKYAADEAEKALKKGLDVFIFSDNVPIEEEVRLKKLGRSLGKLVMGPDCGVGLIKGVALAAGSCVRKGRIGILGASGSGAQEVACVIERCGMGISSLIGTGGRDLSALVGGMTMIDGLERLERDEETDVIVLVSKVADLQVMDKVLSRADQSNKPVVAVFLGAGRDLFEGHRVQYAEFLEDAAFAAVRAAGGDPTSAYDGDRAEAIAEREVKKYTQKQKYLRALYCGGTFAEESLLYWKQQFPDTIFYGNIPKATAGDERSEGHVVLDLGAEEYTENAPHPVFEPQLRNKKLQQVLEDESTAIAVFDVITGPGLHPEPAREAAELSRKALQKRGDLTIVANVCGACGDPQNIGEIIETLRSAGVIVVQSNKRSANIVAEILRRM